VLGGFPVPSYKIEIEFTGKGTVWLDAKDATAAKAATEVLSKKGLRDFSVSHRLPHTLSSVTVLTTEEQKDFVG
jgi:hypothetical protein